SARDLPIEQAQEKMRGAPGTQIQVALRRADQEAALELTLTREVIEVHAVEARVLEDRSVYVRLKVLQATTAAGLHGALDRASEGRGVRPSRGGWRGSCSTCATTRAGY